MIVRLMGGPSMGKTIAIANMSPIPVPVPTPGQPGTYSFGYYKPSKNPDYWVFEGNYKGDPFKSYERKVKKWQRMSRQSGLPLMLSRSF